MPTVSRYLDSLRRMGQRFGPYLLIELFMPGGTLLALLLYLHRRRAAAANDAGARHDSCTAHLYVTAPLVPAR